MHAKRSYSKAFTAADVRQFFLELRERTPHPFVTLMDNARIHVSNENLQWYEDNDFTVIRNISY